MICSDIINAALSILSFILAVISLFSVVVTIRQNNKLLYLNTRPYLSVYFVYEENNSEVFLCIKNGGNSSAIIESLSLTPTLEIWDISVEKVVKDLLLAPGQQVHFLIPEKTELMNGEKVFDVAICYKESMNPKTKLVEQYSLNISYMLHVLSDEHEKGKLSATGNAVRNLEKDVKAMMLNNL